MKQIAFNNSSGYIGGFEQKKAIFEYLHNHGIETTRITDVFNKGFDRNIPLIVAELKKHLWLDGNGHPTSNAKLLIGLSCLPFSWLGDYDLSVLNDKQRKIAEYTNRFPPKSPDRNNDYFMLIRALVKELTDQKIIAYCSFELWEEPDSGAAVSDGARSQGRYFWGTFEQYKSLMQLMVDALIPSGRPIYLSNFTTSLFRDKLYHSKQRWWSYLNFDDIFYKYANVGLSTSFYWKDGGGTFDPLNNDYPKRTYNIKSIITEYSTATGFKAGSQDEKEFNSGRYVVLMVDFLKWAYDKNISDVFIHTFVNFDKSNDGGKLSMYELRIGPPPVFYTEYVPKESGKMFFTIFNVIRFGYELIPNGVKGAQNSLIVTGVDTFEVKPN